MIAAVEGLAAGSGLALVMACDLVVAAETARFSAHPQQTPLTPDGGLSHTLVQALGRARALEVLWQGSPLSAQQWHQWGAAQKLVPGGTAVQAAIEWGEDLARLPASVVSSIKELVNDAPHQSLRAQMTAEKQHALINLAQGQVPGHSAD